MRRRLAAMPAEALQHLGLLFAFILLIAAHGFAAVNPGLTSLLVFIFSCPYLLAAVKTRRAHFLYATMLLGAVSYFLLCYALGAPTSTFPLLSLPLVLALWLVARHLRSRLGPDLAAFPTTVLRAMNITIAAFTLWALMQAPGLMAAAGTGRFVAGAALLGYAALYLAHAIAGAHVLYIYVMTAYLLAGGVLLATAVASLAMGWIPALASAALLLFVGTHFQRLRTPSWSRHFYLCGAVAVGVSLTLAVLDLSYLLLAISLASLTLWLAYGWLSKAVPTVASATAGERALAKIMFLGSIGLAAPLVPAAFFLPSDLRATCAVLIGGLVFAWIAWSRRAERTGERNLYVLPASFFLSAGLPAIGQSLPGVAATVWLLAIPPVLLAGLAVLHAAARKAGNACAERSLAEAVVFPALFTWLVPLLAGSPTIGLVAALVCVLAPVAMAASSGAARFLYAVGPGVAGAVACGSVATVGSGAFSWVLCSVAAVAAGACFLGSTAQKRPVTRAAANLAWLVLSVAAVVFGASCGYASLLYSVAGAGAVAVLMAALGQRDGKGDVFDSLVSATAAVATLAAVVLGLVRWPGGPCVLLLSAAYGTAWVRTRSLARAHLAGGLFGLGMLLLIFSQVSGVEARLGAGAGVVAALFILAAVVRDRFPAVSHSWAESGHLCSIALACSAMVGAWPHESWAQVYAVAPYVLLYGLMPRLRDSAGFRVGAILWATLLVLFGLAAQAGTPYGAQAPVLAALSLLWLALGYAGRRGLFHGWATPLFTSAALVAAFCGAVSLFTPATDGSWRVFLVNGIIFTALFLILRKEVFAYLVTPWLVLMAYDWVKASTTTFTQDVLFYLVIATAVLALFHVLPLLRQWLSRLGPVAIFSIFTWRGAAITALPVLFGGFVIVSAYSVRLTAHPKFCSSCHNMGEYYDSWQHSSHQNVACVECHYEPGIGAELEGKMAGMIQLVKYFAHAYDNKPRALISNKSCMREGCHAEMDHSTETVLFRGKIRFSHEKHLSGHPRGKELNCVSCHGQVVEGKHISVSETTCLTCHFYGRGRKPVAAGDCRTCHITPAKPVEFAGATFDHGDFLEGKKAVQCNQCHSQVTKGDGAVSQTRCQSCHLHRTPDVEDQEKFHLTHVSEGHFDCLQCHDEIRHGTGTMSHQFLVTGHCTNCHGTGTHALQERVYAGAALPGVEPDPDVMYKAGVACDACHSDMCDVKVEGKAYKPGAKECADCHDDKDYGDMLAEWREETTERLEALQPALAALQKRWDAVQDKDEAAAKGRALLAAATAKITCVRADGSLGAHNYAYTSTLLDTVEEEIKESKKALDARGASQESGQ